MADDSIAFDVPPEFAGVVRRCLRQNIPVVALGTAPWYLATIGVLNQTKCTIHWQKLAAFAETFDDLQVTDSIYTKDRGVWTGAGGAAAFDMGTAIIREVVGGDFVDEVCKRNLAEAPRKEMWRQTGLMPWNLPFAGEKLKRAVELMAMNIDDPLPIEKVTSESKLSRRQLERQFEIHLGKSPCKYYIGLRLDRAKQLVEGTTKPLVDIAIACGFVSQSHFSKCYKEHHGISPSGTRLLQNGRKYRGR